MAGAAALEVVRKFEAGNDIRQIVSCSEGGRALRLLKRREDMQKKAEAAKDLIENETKKRKFGTIDSKFGGSQADVLEEEFKKQTVGLMSVEEFTAKRKAIDELITAAQSSGSRKELRLKRKINTKKLSFDDPDMDSGDESDNSNSEVEMEAKPRLAHVKSTKADILSDIMSKKQITSEIENGIKSAMEEFLSLNEFEGRAA
eukprot:TRINITY_DN1786_c0_g1_i1.p1 TRINITY_DN1786_c0_g1~~TRINITY_DN1786_c0_g1_i1.p1  ORF type:complete len:223 (+),score=79.05 TRINITY_DN1786_c0_g1_i1:66-671(+)